MSLRTDSIAQEQQKVQVVLEQPRKSYSDSISGELSKALVGESYKEDIAKQNAENAKAISKEKEELQDKISELEANIAEKKQAINKKMEKIKSGNYSFWDKFVSASGIAGGIASIIGVGSLASGIRKESISVLVPTGGTWDGHPVVRTEHGRFKKAIRGLIIPRLPFSTFKYNLIESGKDFLYGLTNPAILFGAATLLAGGFLISKTQNTSNLEMENAFKEQVENMSKEVEAMQNQLKEYKTQLATLNGNIA